MSTYTVVIEPIETGFNAYVPDLPGCVAAASTLEETHDLIKEAIEFHIEGMRMNGDAVPEPTTGDSFRATGESARGRGFDLDGVAGGNSCPQVKGQSWSFGPANPACADFAVHVEDGSDIVDFSFGLATWEFPYERRYRNGGKDILTEIEEMSRALIAGNCEMRRRPFWATSCIHVGEYTYSVSDIPRFPIPPFGTRRYAPYVSM